MTGGKDVVAKSIFTVVGSIADVDIALTVLVAIMFVELLVDEAAEEAEGANVWGVDATVDESAVDVGKAIATVGVVCVCVDVSLWTVADVVVDADVVCTVLVELVKKTEVFFGVEWITVKTIWK